MKWSVLYLFLYIAPIASWPANSPIPSGKEQQIDIKKVFLSSPLIYSSLGLMSIAAMALWFYTLATFRSKKVISPSASQDLRSLLEVRDWERAKVFCVEQPNLLSMIVQAGLINRSLGSQAVIDAMKAEGKRVSSPFWQRLSLLNDIAMVAPMLGLLGTVVGMFYAFYDLNRSVESVNALFDGLGIAVGTTVAGLIVAILSMIFSTTLKHQLIKTLSRVENEAVALSILIPRD